MLLFKTYLFITQKNIRQQYKNNKLKVIAPTWNDEFELPDGSYSLSDILNYSSLWNCYRDEIDGIER